MNGKGTNLKKKRYVNYLLKITRRHVKNMEEIDAQQQI